MKRGLLFHELRESQMLAPDTLGLMATGGTQFFGNGDLWGADAAFTGSKASSSAGNADGLLVMWPVPITRKISVDALRIQVNTAADTGDVVRLGIYKGDGDGNRPNGLIVDSGDVAIDTTGLKTSTFTAVTLHPGLYWFGLMPNLAGAINPEFTGGGRAHTYYHNMDIADNNSHDHSWVVDLTTATALEDPLTTAGAWLGGNQAPDHIFIQARVA
jgi:hypothetical protein